MLQQSDDFIKEIHGNHVKDMTKFKTRVMKTCTLEELEQLDNRFIYDAEHHNPEG
jgi:hypothetical protein